MKKFILAGLFATTALFADAQMYVEHITKAWYTGPVSQANFDTHDFSGETIDLSPDGTGEIIIDIRIENNSGDSVQWIVSRNRIGVDTAWNDNLCWGHETDQFGGLCIDGASMDDDVWVGISSNSYTTELYDGEAGILYAHILPDFNVPGCGRYRYFVGTTADPYQDSLDVLVCFSLGIEEYSEVSLSVAPNPAKDQVKITGPSNGTLQILNSVGQVVYNGEFNESTIVDVSTLDAGIYFAVLTAEGTEPIKAKIVIE